MPSIHSMSRDAGGPQGQPLTIATSEILPDRYAGSDARTAGAGAGADISAGAADNGGTTANSAPVRRPSHQTRQLAASIRKHSLPPPPRVPPPPPPANASGRYQRAQYPLETNTTLQSPSSDYSEQGDFFVDMYVCLPASFFFYLYIYIYIYLFGWFANQTPFVSSVTFQKPPSSKIQTKI